MKTYFSGFAVAFFFLWLYPAGSLLNVLILAWAIATAISRVCLARHHILDVLGGLGVAWLEFLIMSVLWLSDEKALKFASIFADSEDPWSSG